MYSEEQRDGLRHLFSLSPLLYIPKSPVQGMVSLIITVSPHLSIMKVFPIVTPAGQSGPDNPSVSLSNR